MRVYITILNSLQVVSISRIQTETLTLIGCMAPKQQRPSPLDNPPDASSSEDSGSGSEESDSTQPEPIATKPLPQPSASETDSESESDSDSDEAETVAPMKATQPSKSKPTPPPKSKSKPAASASASPSKSGTKRAVAVESDSKVAKKQETAAAVVESEAKKPEAAVAESEAAKKGKNQEKEDESKKSSSNPFMRVWSEEDELVILKGMIDYAKNKGAAPQSDMAAFQEFIQNSLSTEYSKTQFHDKIRRLKKKYENNILRKNKPTKPHDLSIFELSDKVWGGGQGENGVAAKSKTRNSKKPRISEASSSKWQEVLRFDKGYTGLGFSGSLMKEGLDLVDAAKRGVLDEKWKEVHVAEMELFERKLQLMQEETRLVLEARAKSD